MLCDYNGLFVDGWIFCVIELIDEFIYEDWWVKMLEVILMVVIGKKFEFFFVWNDVDSVVLIVG